MSDTPRTDAEVMYADCADSCLEVYVTRRADGKSHDGDIVSGDFARTLERELYAAIRQRDGLNAEVGATLNRLQMAHEELAAARSELATAREHEAAALSGQRQLLACHDGALRQLEEVRKGLRAVEELIDQSSGVYGLHMNGDLAPWSELRTGGRFEGWMADLDRAINAIPCASKAAGMDATAGEVKA